MEQMENHFIQESICVLYPRMETHKSSLYKLIFHFSHSLQCLFLGLPIL